MMHIHMKQLNILSVLDGFPANFMKFYYKYSHNHNELPHYFSSLNLHTHTHTNKAQIKTKIATREIISE